MNNINFVVIIIVILLICLFVGASIKNSNKINKNMELVLALSINYSQMYYNNLLKYNLPNP